MPSSRIAPAALLACTLSSGCTLLPQYAPDVPTPAEASLDRASQPDAAPPGDATVDDVVLPPDTAACRGVQRALVLPNDELVGDLDPAGGRLGAPSCSHLADGAGQAIYAVHIAAPTTLEFLQASGDTPQGVTVSVRRACDVASSEVGCRDASGRTLHVGLAPGDWYVVIDGAGDGGGRAHYALAVVARPTPANASCDAALTLGPDVPRPAQDVAGGLNGIAMCGEPDPSSSLYYRLFVPANNRAVVTATHPASTTYVPGVEVMASCTAPACVATSPYYGAEPGTEVHVDSPDAGRFVIVELTGALENGPQPFDLAVRYEPMPPAASNARCDAPSAITDGTTLPAEDTSTSRATPMPACLATRGSNFLSYAATLPAQTNLLVTVTPADADPHWVPVMVPFDGCGGACGAPSNDFWIYAPTSFLLTNDALAPTRTLLAVGVSGLYPGAAGPFALSAVAVPELPSAVCASATELADAPGSSWNSSQGGATLQACGTTVYAPLYFHAHVAPGQGLVVRGSGMLPVGSVAIAAFDACGGGCIAPGVYAPGDALFTRFEHGNVGDTAEEIYLAIGSTVASYGPLYPAGGGGEPLPPGARCDTAPTVASGDTASADDSGLGGPIGACAGTAHGEFFPTRVPAGARLTVTGTAVGTGTVPSLYVLPACGAASCLAVATDFDGLAGAARSLAFTNRTGVAQDVVVAVGSAVDVEPVQTTLTFDIR